MVATPDMHSCMGADDVQREGERIRLVIAQRRCAKLCLIRGKLRQELLLNNNHERKRKACKDCDQKE